VGIFWDFENCSPPSDAPGYAVVESIRKMAHKFGRVTLFKAYLELSENTSSKTLNLRSELQSSGVTLADCPHNGRKDVADQMLMIDMVTWCLDDPTPATVILISGDRDFVYAVSAIRQRCYGVVLVVPPQGAHITLKSQANLVLEWKRDILEKQDENSSSDFPHHSDKSPPSAPSIFRTQQRSPLPPASAMVLRQDFGDNAAAIWKATSKTEHNEGVHGCWVQALDDYTSKYAGDLTMKAGQIFRSIERSSDDWWTGELNGRRGLFPSSYVKVLSFLAHPEAPL